MQKALTELFTIDDFNKDLTKFVTRNATEFASDEVNSQETKDLPTLDKEIVETNVIIPISFPFLSFSFLYG